MQVALTNHAVEQFRQRVRPGLDLVEAKAELERLAAAGTLGPMPAWFDGVSASAAQQVLELTPDIVLPIRVDGRGRLVAVSCVTRGEFTATHRKRRNARKAAKRHGRQIKNQAAWARREAKGRKRSGEDRAA